MDIKIQEEFIKLQTDDLLKIRFQKIDIGFPDEAKGEKETSNNSSMPEILLTKYLNFRRKISKACSSTTLKHALPSAIKLSCCSTADLIVGKTKSASIF
uniref:Uncharacterized protein n=1 Tax=Octopus bimaculoides TaxID=37653 RepID=A0A0L8HT50_OCTBM